MRHRLLFNDDPKSERYIASATIGSDAMLPLIPLWLALAAPGVHIDRLFGPETNTGRYKHPASLTELANGDLYLAWYGGDGEYAPGTAVWGSRFTGGKWSAPVKLAQDPFYSTGNPVVWQAPDGRGVAVVRVGRAAHGRRRGSR